MIPRPLLPALARLREEPQGASLPRGQRQGWGRKPTVGDCPSSRQGEGITQQRSCPEGGGRLRPGAWGTLPFCQTPLPYGETLTTSQSRRCLLGSSFRQAQIPPPHLGGLPAKAEAPGPRGGGARCGAGGSGCHGAPPEPRSASPTPTPGPVRGGRVASSNPALFNILQNHWFSAHFLPKTPDTKQETHCPRECRAWKSLLRPLT